MDPSLLAASEFKDIASDVYLCEGARMLLPDNLWVEAGLVNGAMGYLVGFVWPVGGDPSSEQTELRTPLCIIIEFDELDMGIDPETLQPRCFFRLPDGSPDPARRRWVPIFPKKVGAAGHEGVFRC